MAQRSQELLQEVRVGADFPPERMRTRGHFAADARSRVNSEWPPLPPVSPSLTGWVALPRLTTTLRPQPGTWFARGWRGSAGRCQTAATHGHAVGLHTPMRRVDFLGAARGSAGRPSGRRNASPRYWAVSVRANPRSTSTHSARVEIGRVVSRPAYEMADRSIDGQPEPTHA